MSVSRVNKMIFEISGKNTIAEVAARRERPIQIAVASPGSEKNALMVGMATDLALRMYSGEIRIHLAQPASELEAALIKLSIDYDGNDRVRVVRGSLDQALPTLRIGRGDGGIVADSSGWSAYIGCVGPESEWAPVPACAFAVSCAFARLVKVSLLGKADASRPWTLNLLTSTEKRLASGEERAFRELDLGLIGLLGAGAIGSAFAYLLRQSGWRASVDVIDYQRYEEPNEETSLLITRADVLASPKKAERLAALLNTDLIRAAPFVERVIAQSEILLKRRNVFICGVDNVETRLGLDCVNSPLLLNAGLGGTKYDAGHLLFSEHDVGDQRLSALYHPSFVTETLPAGSSHHPHEFQDQCSRLFYDSVSLAAPFMALASAALLLSGVVRSNVGLNSVVQYLKIDLLGQQSSLQTRLRMPASVAGTKTALDSIAM